MIIGLPIVQLLLFGYAINNDPKHLPTALVFGEHSQFTPSIEAALRNSDYFSMIGTMSEAQATNALAKGQVYFVVNVPTDFTRKLLRGEQPIILIEADAADPTAANGALGAARGIVQSVVKKDFIGPLAYLSGDVDAFSIQAHKKYNPEGLTRYNIVPGIIGLILSMTTVMMTALARAWQYGKLTILTCYTTGDYDWQDCSLYLDWSYPNSYYHWLGNNNVQYSLFR